MASPQKVVILVTRATSHLCSFCLSGEMKAEGVLTLQVVYYKSALSCLSDDKKRRYAECMVYGDDPFECDLQVPPGVQKAIEWMATRSSREVMDEREGMISKLEEAG